MPSDNYLPSEAGTLEWRNHIDNKVEAVNSGMGELRDRVGNLETGLAENTRMTKAIRDEMEANSADTSELLQMFRDARGGFRVLGVLGQILKWAIAVGASATALWFSLKGK